MNSDSYEHPYNVTVELTAGITKDKKQFKCKVLISEMKSVITKMVCSNNVALVIISKLY